MKITRILKQGVPLWLLVTMLLATVAGCAPVPTPTPAPAPTPLLAKVPRAEEEGEVRRVVEVKAEGSSLYYLR